jgi:hypothetical protein
VFRKVGHDAKERGKGDLSQEYKTA